MRSGKWKWPALLVALAVTHSQAFYGAEAMEPFMVASTLGLTGISLGVLSTANSGGSNGMEIVTTCLLGVSLTGTLTWGSIGKHKELAILVKVDHDTYLAGGEMTPFLQGVYREVRSRSQELQLKDGPCVGGEIDEGKMTQAIDKLVAMTETHVP